jgi:hypothetical protein
VKLEVEEGDWKHGHVDEENNREPVMHISLEVSMFALTHISDTTASCAPVVPYIKIASAPDAIRAM